MDDDLGMDIFKPGQESDPENPNFSYFAYLEQISLIKLTNTIKIRHREAFKHDLVTTVG